MSSAAQPFWARLPFGRPREEAQVLAVEDATLRSDRFRIAREGEWRRLEAIVSRIEKGRLRRVSDEDLLALPALYRTLASSLAVARETSLDAATIAYLEALAQRAWFIVYGPRASLGAWFAQFIGGGWGEAVRAIRIDIFIALATMVAGVIVGWLLVRSDVQWYYALVPGQFTDERVPGASRAVLQHTLFGHADQNGLTVMASYLFSNNSTVSILAFALGFAFGLPTLMLLLQNTAIMGAMLWLYAGQGLLFDFSCWLAVHGTTELYAILLAGAAGLHVGRAMVFPGTLSVLDAVAAAGRRAATVMVGVVLMLIVAALLEAFARQLVDTSLGRLAIGLFMLVVWTAYLFAWRRRPVVAAP